MTIPGRQSGYRLAGILTVIAAPRVIIVLLDASPLGGNEV